MKHLAALAISVSMLLAQSERSGLHSVTAVRNWSLGEVTRIAIEVSGEFEFRTDRLHDPDRVYFDILNTRPSIDGRRFWAKTLDDRLVTRLRVAENSTTVTRIVLELGPNVEISTSQLPNPYRLMIEARAGKAPAVTSDAVPPVKSESRPFVPPPDSARPEPVRSAPLPEPPTVKSAAPTPRATATLNAAKSAVQPSAPPAAETTELAAKPAPISSIDPRPPASGLSANNKSPIAPPSPELSKAARHNSAGGSSLTRALGLKIGRIVIDPGHGGHDQGTTGVKGLLEKDLVLDVSQRLGKLIEERMNAEVIYTRTDDSFIPLEGRTALANEKKADLFLSIHANSSPIPRIAGVETFYLNFTDSKEALEVATRENATSQRSVFELQDIAQKIALHEKLDESKEFANRIQASLFSFTSRNVAGERNRGIKKAPFVVLIGANMPSVLAEIGFLTNAREEALLKKPDYRQKLADALYRGLSRYAESLSHFQVAQNKE
jgi:N-acetylmuramoyl-L-alanine amidase